MLKFFNLLKISIDSFVFDIVQSEGGIQPSAKNSKMIMIQHYFEIKGIMSKAAQIQRSAAVTTRGGEL